MPLVLCVSAGSVLCSVCILVYSMSNCSMCQLVDSLAGLFQLIECLVYACLCWLNALFMRVYAG